MSREGKMTMGQERILRRGEGVMTIMILRGGRGAI